MQVSGISTAAQRLRLIQPACAGPDSGTAVSSARKNEVAAAARQFEAIIIRQLLNPVVEPLVSGGHRGEGPGVAGGGASMYGYLLTDILADSLSRGRGMGLAHMLERQLSPAIQAAARSGNIHKDNQ